MNSTANPKSCASIIQALRDGMAGLDVFHTLFEDCSDAFEQGRDKDGHRQLADLLQHLHDFAAFCDAIVQHGRESIQASSLAEIEAANRDFETSIQDLLAGYETGDVIKVADVLRLDFHQVISRYKDLFPRLAQELDHGDNP